MEKHLFLRIEEQKSKMSKGQKLIANYIEENYDKAAFMTASKLGETVGVSESTVVRFASEVGYDGYPKLQKAVQEMIRDKLTSIQRIDVTASSVNYDNVLETVLSNDIDKIKTTLDETSRNDFNKAVDAIVNAENIYIFAIRSSAALANFLGYYLDQMLGNVHVVSTTSKIEIYEKLIHINKKDVIIGISFPRYSKTAVEAMQFASDRNASVIALTDSMVSPLISPADYVLLARSDMASVVDSLVAPLSMINALLVATVLNNKENIKETFKQLEEVWDKYDVYAKTSETEYANATWQKDKKAIKRSTD